MSEEAPSAANKWTAWIVGGAVLVVAVGLLTIFIAGPTLARQGGVGQVKKLAAAQLRDPSSAQFRNVARHGIFVCGEVNGKNGYGAYNGFVRFYGDKDSVTIDPGEEGPTFYGKPIMKESFERSYAAYCT